MHITPLLRSSWLSALAATAVLSPASAQTLTTGSAAPAQAEALPGGAVCPVGFAVQLARSPGAVVVTAGPDRNASQQLDLLFSDLPAHRAVSAHITAVGLTPEPRWTPLDAQGRSTAAGPASDPATIRKSVDIVLPPVFKHRQQAAVLFRGFSSVRLVELDSLRFADGTEWHTPSGQPCRAVPNGVLLVGSPSSPSDPPHRP